MKPRYLALLMLWIVLMPLLLALAMSTLDGYPGTVVMVLGIGATIALPVLIDRRLQQKADASRSPSPSLAKGDQVPSAPSLPRVDHDEAGWQELRKKLWRDIEAVAVAHGVEPDILYSKEKWGRLRMRVLVFGGDAAASEAAEAEIRALIEAAGDRSEETCIRCGQPATTGKLDGRILPLCQEHRPPEDKAPGEDMPYAETPALSTDRPDAEASDLSLDEIAEAQAWLLDRMGGRPGVQPEEEVVPPIKPAAVDFIYLADQARASGKWADMEALWSAAFTLEHWHFVSAEAPHAGDYAPYCETAEDGRTVFVMAFSDENLAMRYSPHLLEDGQRKVVPLFALDFETSIRRLHALREQGVFGLLFNHPFSGFYSPLINLIPQYEYYRHRLPDWFEGVDGFDDVVRATGGAYDGSVPAMLLSMRVWVFLADPAQAAAPLTRAVDGHPALLAFTSDAQAERAARQLGLPAATLLRWPPDEALAWMPALAAGGVDTVVFNLASERLTVAVAALADTTKRSATP